MTIGVCKECQDRHPACWGTCERYLAARKELESRKAEKMGEYERKSVKFTAKMSTYDNCVCNACHNVGKVIKLEIPETKYFDGKKLTTRYGELWLCMDCRKKLIRALKMDGECDAE